jgi:hypothetical protein
MLQNRQSTTIMGEGVVCPDGVESGTQLFAPLHCCQSSTSTFHTIRSKLLVDGAFGDDFRDD